MKILKSMMKVVTSTEDYHTPLSSPIALSSARFDAVRRLSELRGSSGLPSSARRAASLAANSTYEVRGPGQSSAFEVFNAIIACRFVAYASFKIVEIDFSL